MILGWMLAACSGGPQIGDEVVQIIPNPPDVAYDTVRTWTDTASDAPPEGEIARDAPIGQTGLDGTWSGPLSFMEAFVPGADPVCEGGSVTMVIDGNAERHVVVRATCSDWTTQVPIGPRYGAMTAIGFATLDPTDLTSFRFDITFAAPNMATYSRSNQRARVTEAGIEVSWDDIGGIGQLQFGHAVSWTATREVAP